jgi:hypothetical protein
MLVAVAVLEGFKICGARVNHDQLSSSHFNLLRTKVL